MEAKTYDGQKIEISSEGYEEYMAWQNELLRRLGQDLASKMPKYYGRIEFNIQGGKFVNANLVQGIK